MWFKKKQEAKMPPVSNNGQSSETVPPVALSDYENDKKDLGRTEFAAQYTKSSGNANEAEELADSIYQKD